MSAEEYRARIPVDNVVDTTGCGDSFAAGMAFGYLEHRDFVAACRYGNAMGAQRCAGSALQIYRSLPDTPASNRRSLRHLVDDHQIGHRRRNPHA